jgi:uncharacterized UBP type Zn finger protein
MATELGCTHLGEIRDVEPLTPGLCQECVERGDTWVHLRVCMTCGHVGCCDDSKNRHARRHSHETGHPIIQSYQPGETWRYCFVDRVQVPDGKPFPPY